MTSRQQPSAALRDTKRTRAKLPKVRTGCLTCKVRHKKCDETKPICQRCRDGDYQCDGYKQVEQLQCKRQKAKDKPKSLFTAYSERVLNLSYPSGLGGIPGNSQEKHLFSHVAYCTIKDLIGYSPSLATFWYDYVLPLGHSLSPVRHALISLGASHRSFLWKYTPEICAPNDESHDSFAVQQYNKAISDLTPIMADPSLLDIQAILICCLIFVCIENLNGRYAEALKHLRAGSGLLSSIHPSTNVSPANGSGHLGQLTVTPGDINELGSISDMFARLGLDTSLLMNDRFVHHPSFHTHPATTTEGCDGPFKSSTIARDRLREIDLDHQDYWYCAEGYSCSKGAADDNSSLDRVPVGPCVVSEEDIQKYQDLCDQFARWNVRFNLYLDGIHDRSISDTELSEAAVLSLHAKVWTVIMHQGPCCDIPIAREEFEDILDQAERIVPLSSSSKHPIFSFEADTIPNVSFVATFCKDVDLQKRAIAILRSVNRKEGIWDSQKMADLYEAALLAGRSLEDVDFGAEL